MHYGWQAERRDAKEEAWLSQTIWRKYKKGERSWEWDMWDGVNQQSWCGFTIQRYPTCGSRFFDEGFQSWVTWHLRQASEVEDKACAWANKSVIAETRFYEGPECVMLGCVYISLLWTVDSVDHRATLMYFLIWHDLINNVFVAWCLLHFLQHEWIKLSQLLATIKKWWDFWDLFALTWENSPSRVCLQLYAAVLWCTGDCEACREPAQEEAWIGLRCRIWLGKKLDLRRGIRADILKKRGRSYQVPTKW